MSCLRTPLTTAPCTRLVVLALAALLAVPSRPAAAAPCAGFNDVDSTNVFCPDVQWLKNRGVTLGCAPEAFCPAEPVSRLSMAAFMNRLGRALTPERIEVSGSPGAIDLDGTSTIVCQTADFVIPADSYARRFEVDAKLNAIAPGEAVIGTRVVATTNGGATWFATGQYMTASVAPQQWVQATALGNANLEAGQTIRWGIHVWRFVLPGTIDLSDSHCQLRVRAFGTSD